uniref:Phosphatase 2A Regulatory Subunit A helical domain-containing protein n=1 Tax=Romanomermis culicivorax TaxID=13658 RepID=A0A915K969_ROMCU
MERNIEPATTFEFVLITPALITKRLYNDRVIVKKLKLSGDQVLSIQNQALIVSLTTSLIRILAYTENKLKAMRMLKLMATCSKEPIILDQISPYIV